MKKRFFSGLAAVCFLLLFALPVSAKRQYEDCIANCKLYDPDGLFDEVERADLTETIRNTSEKADMYVAVCILNDESDPIELAKEDAKPGNGVFTWTIDAAKVGIALTEAFQNVKIDTLEKYNAVNDILSKGHFVLTVSEYTTSSNP